MMKRWYKMIRGCGTGTLIAAMLCLVGCQEAKEVGEEAGDALEEAGEATMDAADKVGDEMQDAVN